MFVKFLLIFIGIMALMGAGGLSFSYLEKTMGPREGAKIVPLIPQSSVTPEAIKPATKAVTTTQPAQKKVVVKTPTSAKSTTSAVPKTATIEKTVLAPGPLRAVQTPVVSSSLTISGVIDYTNKARTENGGLPALTENFLLNQDAQMKLSDMFTKQYFEHVSPAGIGPAELAQKVGYAYVVVGENLALGDFGSDQGVVTAWMNSPGHRANILNTHYQEIGVAVAKGMYEGRMTWLAVQSFGMPLSACPASDPALKAQIDANNLTITNLRAELDAKKALLDATPQTDPNYNNYVNDFNTLVPQFNALVEANRIAVENYNAGVQAFNTCINAVSVH